MGMGESNAREGCNRKPDCPPLPLCCSIDATDVRLGKKSGNFLIGTECGKRAKARGAPHKNQGEKRKAIVLRDMH